MSEQITFRPGDPPPSCQHYRIDPETARCAECDEQMIAVTVTPETVLSAPNLAACHNPACLAALEDGTYEDDQPGCTNPHGVYIEDRSRAVEVTLGWNYDYECERCRNGDDMIMRSGEPIIWPCGTRHHAYVWNTERKVSS